LAITSLDRATSRHGGAGLSFAGLTVDQFQRRTSVVEYQKSSLEAALPFVKKFAEVEGLDAHGWSAAIRVQKPARGSSKDKGEAK